MRKSRSSGSVGERGGNEPLYPDIDLGLSINSGYRWSRALVNSTTERTVTNVNLRFVFYDLFEVKLKRRVLLSTGLL
jgi:hypothetical protein